MERVDGDRILPIIDTNRTIKIANREVPRHSTVSSNQALSGDLLGYRTRVWCPREKRKDMTKMSHTFLTNILCLLLKLTNLPTTKSQNKSTQQHYLIQVHNLLDSQKQAKSSGVSRVSGVSRSTPRKLLDISIQANHTRACGISLTGHFVEYTTPVSDLHTDGSSNNSLVIVLL